MFWFILAILAGVLNGSFTLPMKYTRKWRWEHTWGMWSGWALLILPVLVAVLTVPDISEIYSGDRGRVVLVFIIGCGWGIGAITFGMGVHYLGIALGFSIIMGLTTSVGSLIPLVLLSMDDFDVSTFLIVLAGVLLIIFGICVCSLAGHFRDKTGGIASERKSFLKGVIICIIAGLMGSFINFAFIFGMPLIEKANSLGVSPMFSGNVVWMATLPGGFLINFGYCCYLMNKNKNAKLLLADNIQTHWLFTFLMGLSFFGSITLYGIATIKLGRLGPAVG
jgi:L-rhamnose-H+ transport protein